MSNHRPTDRDSSQDQTTVSRAVHGLPRFWGLALTTAVLGVVIGCFSGLLGVFLIETERFFLGFQESAQMAGPWFVSPWRRLVSVTIGGVVVAVVWWALRNRTQRVPSVHDAVDGARMPWWQTVIHAAAQIFFVGTGASIGREVAPREAGAMIAQNWLRLGSRLGLRPSDARLVVAAAAGAGFAGVYISPLTGMFFSVEMSLKKINIETVSVSLGMSAISTLVGGAIKGTQPYYAVGHEPFLPWLMVFAVITSPLCAMAGSLFRKGSQWAQRHQTTGTAILWQLPLVALVTGAIAMLAPQVMGNGRALAQVSISELATSAIPLLLVLCAGKAVLTLATLRTGASGGVITPAISIGASLGASLGMVWVLLFPASGVQVWQCALVGAVAVLTASQQAPLMALMMLVEITHLPVGALVPLGLAAAVSAGVSSVILPRLKWPRPISK